jgi:hypothetical protein
MRKDHRSSGNFGASLCGNGTRLMLLSIPLWSNPS